MPCIDREKEESIHTAVRIVSKPFYVPTVTYTLNIKKSLYDDSDAITGHCRGIISKKESTSFCCEARTFLFCFSELSTRGKFEISQNVSSKLTPGSQSDVSVSIHNRGNPFVKRDLLHKQTFAKHTVLYGHNDLRFYFFLDRFK